MVDDEPAMRELVGSMLSSGGHEVATADSVAQARILLAGGDFDAIVCDVSMPGESGVALLNELADNLQLAKMLISGNDDPLFADRALAMGAYAYLVKPFTRSQLLIHVVNSLRRRELEQAAAAQRTELEQAVKERTSLLEHSYEEAVQRLSAAAETRDVETGRHITRMSSYCELLALRLGMGEKKAAELRIASPLHDIGKLGIPDAVLLKPGRLTEAEYATMKRHTEIGHEMLAGSSSPLLQMGALLALTHHERFDGSGYPYGLSGDTIPVEGRVAAVADVFDALTSRRVYREALTFEDAFEHIVRERGREFDPLVVDALVGSRAEIAEIHRTHQETLDGALWQRAQNVVPRPATTAFRRSVPQRGQGIPALP